MLASCCANARSSSGARSRGSAPTVERPGYDFVVQAEAGWMAITGPVDGAPSKVGVAFADVLAGRDAAIAILAALVGRERRRRRSDSAHLPLHSAVAASSTSRRTPSSPASRRRWGNAHPNLVPYELFEAADRSFRAGRRQRRAVARRRGRARLRHPDVADGWRTNAGRVADRARSCRRWPRICGSATPRYGWRRCAPPASPADSCAPSPRRSPMCGGPQNRGVLGGGRAAAIPAAGARCARSAGAGARVGRLRRDPAMPSSAPAVTPEHSAEQVPKRAGGAPSRPRSLRVDTAYM
jgi:hypothetical protein